MKTRAVALVVVTLLSFTIPAVADEGRDFVTAFSAAVNGKSKSVWEAFLSPASRACLAGPGKEMLERAFASDTRVNVPPDSKVWVTRIGGTDALMGEGMLSYGDRPTHYFQIDLGPPGRATSSLIRYGRLQNGRWQYVVGCPTTAGMAQAKVTEKARTAADAEARIRAKNLPPALVAEIRRLVADGKIMAATQSVANATGAELAIARGIVRTFENQPAGR
ncbi:MAG: hypothetical protein K9J42_12155 [Sulfuritalea sp.]|nr:hypothetical protein [Sulfuritalea sp.]